MAGSAGNGTITRQAGIEKYFSAQYEARRGKGIILELVNRRWPAIWLYKTDWCHFLDINIWIPAATENGSDASQCDKTQAAYKVFYMKGILSHSNIL